MIRTVLIAAALFAASAHPIEARVLASDDFRSIAPHDWTLLPKESGQRGRRFVSSNGNAWLWLYAEPAREPIPLHLETVLSGQDERITYERRGQTWIVVSGYRGNRIFYRKAMLACGGHKWHHLAFEYPAAEKRAFDRFVTRASYALKSYQAVGCHRETDAP
jgi:hypothetical protein